jgi:hypothetical protein
LLAQFCELAVTQQVNLRMMVDTRGAPEWQRAVRDLAQVLNSTAVKLRLAISSAARAKSGVLTEREPKVPKNKSVLFGGPSNILRF